MALITKTVTITGGDATGLSTSVSLGGSVVGIAIPSNWTAAPISFQNSYDNGMTFLDVFNEQGSELSLGVQPGFNQVSPSFLGGASTLVIRSGLLGGAVTQASDVTITLQIKTS